MQVSGVEGTWMFLSHFVGAKERVTIKGTTPNGNPSNRVIYEPRLSSFMDHPILVCEQLTQLNKARDVFFFPGQRRQFSKMSGYVHVTRQGGAAPSLVPISRLTQTEKEQVLEATNLRSGIFKCVYVSTREANRLASAPVAPTSLIKSGSGLFHAVWLLDEAIEGNSFLQLQRAISDYLGVTPFSVDDPFISLPGCDFINADGNREQVSIEFFEPENTYSIDEIKNAFDVVLSSESNEIAFYPLAIMDPDVIGHAMSHDPKFMPNGTILGDKGVFFRAEDDGPLIPIITTPLWLADIVQTGDTREAHLKLEWRGYGDRLETATMPMSHLADKRALSSFLYQHNVSGFSAKQAQSLIEYLRGSAERYNSERSTSIGYSRFGWSSGGFVIGSEIVTSDGTTPAQVVRVPQEIKDGLTSKGDLETWTNVTAQLDSDLYWPHRFTLQAILGSPLLKLLKADSAILSLAGESGTGKTTIAEFGLSAYGKPKALEIAPQSTEKAFQERWRIANNLPILCNEAATIDSKRINNIVYAAANGEPRDTLTQKVELRSTNQWTTLTVFTSNNHLQGLDEQQLNEAGRRRILELTIETALEGEIARDLNDVMREHYGRVGREFLTYVVANEAEVSKQLNEAFDWAIANGVRSEDRFSAWIISAAKVAGEIAYDLGLFRFEVIDPCIRAIEATKNQAKAIKTSNQRVDELITEFINANQDHFSQYRIDGRGEWITTEARGEVVGRCTIENSQPASVAIAKQAFIAWARTRGIDSQHISRYAQENAIDEKGVKLVPHGKNTRCLIIPIAKTPSFHLAHVESISLNTLGKNNSKE